MTVASQVVTPESWIEIARPRDKTSLPASLRDLLSEADIFAETDHVRPARRKINTTRMFVPSLQLVKAGDHSAHRIPVEIPFRKQERDIGLTQVSQVLTSVRKRLQELTRLIKQEDGFMREASFQALLDFIQQYHVTKAPAVFASANGNVRAVWRAVEGPQVGIQFLGDGRGQFILFRHGIKDGRQILGVEDLKTLMSSIKFLGLNHLFNDRQSMIIVDEKRYA